jgi:hypothetical protein
MMQACSTMRRTFVLFLVEASWPSWFSIGIHVLWGADGSNSTTALQPQRSQRAAINSSDFTSAAASGDTSARPVRQAVARAGKCWTTAPAPLRPLPMATAYISATAMAPFGDSTDRPVPARAVRHGHTSITTPAPRAWLPADSTDRHMRNSFTPWPMSNRSSMSYDGGTIK